MKTILFKCPKYIYDEIIKCRYFPSTELIQPEDGVKFNDIYKVCPNCEELVDEEIKPNYLGEYYHGWCDKWVKPDVDTFGTHKATPVDVNVNFHKWSDGLGYSFGDIDFDGGIIEKIPEGEVSNELHNWIKENFKANFIMNRLENE